jgi:hypothetical protein
MQLPSRPINSSAQAEKLGEEKPLLRMQIFFPRNGFTNDRKNSVLPRILQIVQSSGSFSAPGWPHICQKWQGAEAGNNAASL